MGEDDRHITSVDEDGVALAAIKALEARVRALDARDAELETRISALVPEAAGKLPKRK